MTTHKYRNPWHKPGKPEYGPLNYETIAEPTEYMGGYLIFNPPERPEVWDVVKDGVCVTQRAGPRGARQAIEELIAKA